MAKVLIAAAAAVKLFAAQGIKVQTVTTVKQKDAEGKQRDVKQVEMKPLAAAHVLSAKQAPDGLVTLVTIDGQKFTAQGEPAAPEGDDKGKK